MESCPRMLLCVDWVPLRRALAQGVDGIGFDVEEADDYASLKQSVRAYAWDMVVLGLFRAEVDIPGVLRLIETDSPRASTMVLRGSCDRVTWDSGDVQASVRSVLGAGLLIRLAGSLRSLGESQTAPLRWGDLELLPGACRVTINGIDIGCTPCEYRILEHLALRSGEVVSPQELLRGISGSQPAATSNVVAQWVSRVRTKVRACGGSDPIETRRGFGYAFTYLR